MRRGLFVTNDSAVRTEDWRGVAADERFHQLMTELENHHDLLAGILAPLREGRSDLSLLDSQRQLIVRLLYDIKCLIRGLPAKLRPIDTNCSSYLPGRLGT